jgi:hypothetical protein
MGRYFASSVIRDNKQKRKLSTTIIPQPPKNSEEVLIKTTSPERLDNLAKLFYDDSTLWWIIASANNLGKGSWIVPQNTTLRIPDKTFILDNIRVTNKTR